MNPHHLSILLRNLLENALNYTPAGKSVNITLQTRAAGLELHILDQGPGVREDALPRIVDRFYRAEQATTDGCGLGLSIVKRIADLYNLDLTFHNRAESGLDASVNFPKVQLCEEWETT